MAEQKKKHLSKAKKINEQVEIINDVISSITGYDTSDHGEFEIKRLIKRFGFDEVYECTEIAMFTYFDETWESVEYAFNKIGGICYNRAHNIGAKKHGH